MRITTSRGFTLIELLVTVAIVGVLATIAIPQFKQYRLRGLDARAKTDLHNVASAEEAYYADYERYIPCDQTTCMSLLPAIRELPSPGVVLSIDVPSATSAGFTGSSQHLSSPTVFNWDSRRGGLR